MMNTPSRGRKPLEIPIDSIGTIFGNTNRDSTKKYRRYMYIWIALRAYLFLLLLSLLVLLVLLDHHLFQFCSVFRNTFGASTVGRPSSWLTWRATRQRWHLGQKLRSYKPNSPEIGSSAPANCWSRRHSHRRQDSWLKHIPHRTRQYRLEYCCTSVGHRNRPGKHQRLRPSSQHIASKAAVCRSLRYSRYSWPQVPYPIEGCCWQCCLTEIRIKIQLSWDNSTFRWAEG